MLKFYFNGSPNPTKVALFLEESGLPYEAIPVDTRKGEQFAAGYGAVNPNGKVPAIVDGDVSVFDSNAGSVYALLGSQTRAQLAPNHGSLGTKGSLFDRVTKSGYLNAVQLYQYNEGALYHLYAAPEQVTDIALQPGETLSAVSAGDTVRWVIGDTTSGSGGERRGGAVRW